MRFLGASASKKSPISRKQNQKSAFWLHQGKAVTNGGNATQFYVGRCADISDMLVQSEIAVNGNAKVFNWLANLISDRYTGSKVGTESAVDARLEVTSIASVFLSLSCSLFSVNHDLTSLTHSSSQRTVP